ncbi:MAG TPA: metal ABC transporter ATP-binding protein [Saprospiraceae bacterium]|nr:metal ABC transporter ATP-binding protein [Saprospiraceae bacterium]
MEKTVIDIKGLNVSYTTKRILTNIYLEIKSGKSYGLIGPNGAGKNTLLKAILGLTEGYFGKISVFDQSIDKIRDKIAYVPQKDEIDWSFPASVDDVVMMGRYPHKKIYQRLNQSDRDIVDKTLHLLEIADLKDRQIGQLSGGQQQRVFIARAIAQQPDIYLLDEPFVGVDITSEKIIIGIMKALVKEGKTLITVHHDLTSIATYFDSVIMINQRLIAAGSIEEVFNQENLSKCFGPQLTMLQKSALLGA